MGTCNAPDVEGRPDHKKANDAHPGGPDRIVRPTFDPELAQNVAAADDEAFAGEKRKKEKKESRCTAGTKGGRGGAPQ